MIKFIKKWVLISFVFFLRIVELGAADIKNNEDYLIHVMDFYPSHYKDQTGKIVGREVERIEKAFLASGKKVRFTLVPINRCLYLLDNGAAKMCGTLAVSKNSRYENVEFNKVALNPKKSRAIFVKYTNNKKQYDLSNLNKLTVSVYDLPEYLDELKRRGAIPDPSMDDIGVVRKLAAKRIEVGVIHESTYNYFPKHEKDQLKILGDFIDVEGFVGFSTHFVERKKAMDELDRGLRLIQQNGTMDEINKKWLDLVERKIKKIKE